MSVVMDGVVKEICQSMENNPNRWVIATYILNDKVSGINYWLGEGSITQIWNGLSRDVVFSYTQGKLVYESFCKMKEDKASEAQQKVINSFTPKINYILYKVPVDSKWWEFWK